MTVWPHAPTHQLSESGTYMVTAATYQKQHRFRSTEMLQQVQDGLLRYASRYEWQLEAWAVFSNHYHFIGHSPENAATLSKFLSHFHSRSAAWLNKLEGATGRKVGHNFWDTQLTHHRSYLARLNYVHQNACKHGLVATAADYPFCSAGWFARVASTAQQKTIGSFPTDKVKVLDEFEPVWDR